MTMSVEDGQQKQKQKQKQKQTKKDVNPSYKAAKHIEHTFLISDYY